MQPTQAAEILMLALAISVDAFAAAFTYGADGIKIPRASALVIHALSLACICASLVIGLNLGEYLPEGFTRIAGFAIMLALGVVKLFDGIFKSLLMKTESRKKDIAFSLMSLNFILSVYANPESADADRSKSLSPREAAILALTLSADSFPIGIGMGLSDFPLWCVVPLMILADEAALRLGNFFGKKAAEKLRPDVSWLGGALLIIMAFSKII